MKVLVMYSGGKDSQASLIWAINEYGVNNIEAVFCDTGWESPITYKHIVDTTNKMGVKLITVKSETYTGMIDLAEKKKRFPSTKARFCTEKLKQIPAIDYVLQHEEHLIIIQGIRASESASRSKMKAQCRYFKFYFEPYKINKKGKQVFHTYRKKDVFKWVAKYSDDIIRPVFDWSGQQVIDYIIENGFEPNTLYRQGFKRVGCFPCIMSGHNEVYEIIKRYPEQVELIINEENRIGKSFFPPDYIPAYACSGISSKGKYPKMTDVRKYLTDKKLTGDMFNPDNHVSCSSYYHLCE